MSNTSYLTYILSSSFAMTDQPMPVHPDSEYSEAMRPTSSSISFAERMPMPFLLENTASCTAAGSPSASAGIMSTMHSRPSIRVVPGTVRSARRSLISTAAALTAPPN